MKLTILSGEVVENKKTGFWNIKVKATLSIGDIVEEASYCVCRSDPFFSIFSNEARGFFFKRNAENVLKKLIATTMDVESYMSD